jgi:hypothetical protein
MGEGRGGGGGLAQGKPKYSTFFSCIINVFNLSQSDCSMIVDTVVVVFRNIEQNKGN